MAEAMALKKMTPFDYYIAAKAIDHTMYMEEMTKRIQTGGIIRHPQRIYHRLKLEDEDEDEEIISLEDADSSISEQMRHWLPSMWILFQSNENCPPLAAAKYLAQIEDSKFSIEYLNKNELVAWFVLFMFSNKVNADHKGCATVCLKRLLARMIPTNFPDQTIYQTSAEQLLLYLLTLPLTLEDNVEVVRQACCAFAFLCVCSKVNLNLDGIRKSVIKNHLLELAKNKEYTYAWPALYAFRHIACDDLDMWTIIVKEKPCFLLELLGRDHGNDDKHIIEEACWTVENLLSRYGNGFLQDDLWFAHLVKQSSSGDIYIESAAAFAIATSAAGATRSYIMRLIKMGCLEVMCRWVHYDDLLSSRCLDGIEHILQVGDPRTSGYRNVYADWMDKCFGWSELMKVSSELRANNSLAIRAHDIVGKYHIWSDSDEDALQNDSKKPRLLT